MTSSAPWAQSHLVAGPAFANDPDYMEGPLRRFPYRRDPRALRRSWRAYAGPWHFNSMQMRYTGLDPSSQYRLKIVYSSLKPHIPLRLTAQDGIEIHPFITRADPPAPVSFDIPAEATSTGELLLTWEVEHGRGGNPGGAGVSEVWLMRK